MTQYCKSLESNGVKTFNTLSIPSMILEIRYGLSTVSYLRYWRTSQPEEEKQHRPNHYFTENGTNATAWYQLLAETSKILKNIKKEYVNV